MNSNDEAKNWWNSLSTGVQDAMSRVACPRKAFDLDVIYNAFGKTIK